MKNKQEITSQRSLSGKWRSSKASCSLGSATLAAWMTLCGAHGGVFSSDFNFGQPPGTAVYGSAYIDSFGGVADTGALKLTTSYGQTGSFIIDDLDSGAPITGFTAGFKMLIGGGNQADGLSFNFANDLPDDSFGEEGAGSGFVISFDTYDNGGGEAPAIDVTNGGVTIASAKGNLELFRTSDYVDVLIQVSTVGSLTLTVNGTQVFTELPGAFSSSSGRFAIGARTGGFYDNQFIDDLQIATIDALPEHPFPVSMAPLGTGVREDANIQVVLQDGLQIVDPSSVRLNLNGTEVSPAISKSGNRTTIAYDPPALLESGLDQNVSLTFSDNGDPATAQTVSYAFQVRYSLGPTGNIYEAILAPGISWEDANREGQARTYHGRPGHLATIASYDEDIFVNKVRTTSFPNSAQIEMWLGGWQTPGLGSADGWHWVNNDGDFPGTNDGAIYSHWRSGEPNDYYGVDSENYLSLGLFGEFGWNDEGYPPQMGGYLVEYEALPVRIDIKPDSNPNVVNVQDQGKISVVLFSQPGFDASKINPSSIRFGRTGKEAAPLSWSKKDVDGDQKLDLALVFNVQDTAWRCGDDSGILIGRDAEGLSFKGSDSVQLKGCPPYALAIIALQDLLQNTEIQLRVTPLLKGYQAPSVAQKIQLKSYKISGQLGWTKNVDNTPLSPQPDGASVGSLTYSDLLHFQKIEARANVPNSKSAKTEILSADTRVLYRPDLALNSIACPSQVNNHQLVNISAVVDELKGDLGAIANAYLLDGADVIDSIADFRVNAQGSATLVFSARFDSVGAHALKIIVSDVNPGDYDPENNEASFSTEVIQPPFQPVYYDASYDYYDQESFEEWDDDYSTGTYHNHSRSESFYQTLYLPQAISFPIADTTDILSVDGTARGVLGAQGLQPYYAYDDGCVRSAYASAYLGDNTYLNIQSDKYCWGYEQAYVSVARYVSESTYFSSVYYKWYGYGYTDGPYTSEPANFLNVSASLSSWFTIQAPEGGFGGRGGISDIYTYQYNEPFETVSETGYHRGFNSYLSKYGYGSGLTTP